MSAPTVKLDRGVHVLHLFYRIDRAAWAALSPDRSGQTRSKLEALCAAYAAPCAPRLLTYAPIGGKGDLAFLLFASELAELSQMHHGVETAFVPGTLQRVYSYLSVTELSEYSTTDEDSRQTLVEQEKLIPGSDAFNQRMNELRDRIAKYQHYRLYPEMPDWEVMAFYPMSKRRGTDNWYALDFPTRKGLMAGHARVGRKFAGRVSQLITGSTGLDDWEWGVTLMAHQVDAIKEIVYEMRFDEVSARYAEFGPFYINLRLAPADLWGHLQL